MIRNFNHIGMLMMLYFFSTNAFSNTIPEPRVHTWQTIFVNSGAWLGTLRMINEKGTFVNENGEFVDSFAINSKNPFKFGFVLDTTDDFDVAYSLTLTKKPDTLFQSKTCVFIVTAQGPANPDVRYNKYNDAACAYKINKDVGIDFFVE